MNNEEVCIILHNVLDKCNEEKKAKTLLVPVENVIERVSFYTGFSITSIRKLSNKPRGLLKLDQLLLLKCIKIVLLEFKMPTINNVYHQYLKECPSKIDSHLTLGIFVTLLNELGYDYRKSRSGELIIVENPIKTFERYNYLKKALELRKDTERPFYYVDAKSFTNKKKVPKIGGDDITSSEQYGHFFMISGKGYEHGLFTTQMNNKDFKNWIGDILVPLLKPSSVIIICSHHMLDTVKKITCYSSKKEMCTWLKDNNIPYDTTMRKAELYELIDKCTSKAKQHDIDRLLKSQGHEVLHLPSSFDFSPSKLLYQYVINKFNIKTDNNLTIKQSVLDVIKDIGVTKWIEFETKTADIENKIFDGDAIIEKQYESIFSDLINDEFEATDVCSKCNRINVTF